MKVLKLKENEHLMDIRAIPLDRKDICGFYLYSAYLCKYNVKAKKLVIVALKDRKMYFVGNLIRYSWKNIQKLVDKIIIEHVVGLAKENALFLKTKIKGFSSFIKVGKTKIYLKNVENYENLVLMLKHDYVAFKDNVLKYIKGLNNWFLTKV